MGKTICSWCDKVILEDNDNEFDGDSFGICKKCHDELQVDLDNFKKKQEEAKDGNNS